MTIIDLITERRLLASLLTEPPVLSAADAVESRDFTDPHHWVVFAAIRQLQTEGADVCILEVNDILAQRDATYHTDLVAKAGLWFLVDLILESGRYNHAVLWEHDMWWLKELRRRREALEEAA